MRCRFCFATFQDVKQSVLPKGHLPQAASEAIINELAEIGFEKINFAGGEPTLCKWLPDLIRHARTRGMKTSIVTNGTMLTEAWLDRVHGALDWIALSIDTVVPATAQAMGRSTRWGPLDAETYLDRAEAVRRQGIRLKMNTVVTALNWQEDLSDFILALRPERWKIFQVLPVAGQNDGRVEDLLLSRRQFEAFVARHRALETRGITLVPESNDLMTGSYVMIDPAGRFFDNTAGRHTYSRPILEVGAAAALRDVAVDPERFAARDGRYAW